MATVEINFPVDTYVEPNHGSWEIIPLDTLKREKDTRLAHRLNSLGSLFYFSKVTLKNRRLSENFHYDICLNLEREHLKEILEVPRDHFKSTICSESAPMWWALPFSEEDADLMRVLGYGEAWIKWMRRAHNQDTRTLLISENITNAAKLGVRVDGHYKNNKFFTYLFPEIRPNKHSTWTQFSMTHGRSANSKPHGEGTFDYLGVGAALQSRHYDRVVQDDLVGKAAIDSDTVMQKTIEYHKLLVGAFDSNRDIALDNDEIVVGNRWSWRDLNSYIRENETYFRITNHSALGGCCELHPAGSPIFPEEFSIEKLERFSKRLGTYLFSCQFLNAPTTPEASAFDEKLLRYYRWGKETTGYGEDKISRTMIAHEVDKGEAINDIPVSNLQITMVVDPNHSGEEGRCHHAITVVGVLKGKTKVDGDRIYLLDCWAESSSYDKFIAKIYELAEKYRLREFWLETIAAQRYLKYHLEFRNRVEGRKLKVRELKSARTKGAKNNRILALGPTFENRQFWIRRGDVGFIKEFTMYPNAPTKDILDTLGYALQVWGQGFSRGQVTEYMQNFQQQIGAGPCGY